MGLPWGEVIQNVLPMLGSFSQSAAEGEARQRNEQRYGQGLELIQNLGRRQRVGYGSLYRNALNLYGRSGDEQAGFFNKMDTLATRANSQERADLEGAFKAEGANTRAGLAARGMTGTTIAPTMRRGLMRKKEAAMGRLADKDTRLKMGLMDARRQSRAKHAYGLADVYTQLKQQKLGIDAEATGREVNWIGDREDVYPSQAAYLNLMGNYGRSTAPTPEQPGPDYLTSIGAPVAGGVASAATLALMLSDEEMKEDFETIDELEILEQIRAMEVLAWRYKTSAGVDDGTRHVGPTAQTFQKETGLGNGRVIPVVDAIGLLFAGLQALAQTVEHLIDDRQRERAGT